MQCSTAITCAQKSSTLMGEIAMIDVSGTADRLEFVGHSWKMII